MVHHWLMEWYHYYLWTQQLTDGRWQWQCSLLCHCHPHKLPHDWSSEMYHIKFHFTTVNDDESAKNNQSVSSFPEETHMRKLARFLAWFLNFVLMGPAYGASEDTLKKWAASHCTWLYLFLQCTPDGQPAPLIYNTHYWGLPSYKIGRFKKLHTDDFYAWRLINWFRTT